MGMDRFEKKSETDGDVPPALSTKLEKMNKDIMDAVKALDSKSEDTRRNAEKALQDYQTEADKHFKKLREFEEAKSATEKKAAELEGRVKDVEHALATKSSGDNKTSDPRDTAEYKSFAEFVKSGEFDKKTLRTDSETAGGALLPAPMDSEIRKNITEIAPVRSYARVRTMPSKTLKIPRRLAGLGRAPFEGEAEEGDTGVSKYGEEQITVFRQTWTVPITLDMLMMSGFDMESEMVSDVFESFAEGEGYAFLFGNGVKMPKGILTDGKVQVVNTAAAGQLTFDDFATVSGELKRGQKPMYFMNRRTLAQVWRLKGSDGHPIWAPVASGGSTPATIFGHPYDANMIHLDDYTPAVNNKKPVLFGDMRRHYEIFDMTGISVVRDEFTQKKKGIVEFTFTRYLTGQPIQPEAMKVLRVG